MRKRDAEVQESRSSFGPQPFLVIATHRHYMEADSTLISAKIASVALQQFKR